MSSVFGLDPSDRLVSVSQVHRGLACGCRCVVCGEPLVARQGSVREHHFAHASGREPCAVSPESLLHRFAKQVIADAGGLVVPMDAGIAATLGLEFVTLEQARLNLVAVDIEKTVADIRPDLLATTASGMTVAIEIACTSFCDRVKIGRFEALGLPALEIDLRDFIGDAFDVDGVRAAIVSTVARKTWLRTAPPESDEDDPLPATTPSFQLQPATAVVATAPAPRPRLPEEIVEISGRWVSIKTFTNGDISIRAISYDPDVVSIVRTIAKANHAYFAPRWKSWNVPRWRADAARAALKAQATAVRIIVQDCNRPAA